MPAAASQQKLDSLLFLDFDGVLCDSVSECFVSSWIAYYERHRQAVPDRVDLNYRRVFDTLRPYIRNGEDYLVIHESLSRGLPLDDQNQFDLRISEIGHEGMQAFRALIYAVRQELLQSSQDFWVSLHRMYDSLLSPLMACASNPAVYILSTKKQEYILKMLNGIPIDPARVLSSGGIPKKDIIDSIMESHGSQRADFIDDHIDHLRQVRNPAVSRYLAKWGYVRPEWLNARDMEVIDERRAIEIMQAYS
ncbi:MAG: hypothetical protein D6B26_05875 [Spirochaetaceae bacterium]|nr:MAG: hypothetical protein D6B26_05875 [Spirochaetaceae bacterium]